MKAFSVLPEGLDGYAGQLDRAARDIRDGREYLQRYVEIGGEGGEWWGLASDAHRKAVAAVSAVLDRAGLLLDTSRKELAGAGVHYRMADAAALQRMDATLSPLCLADNDPMTQAWADNGCPPSFADSRNPSGRLKPVDDVKYSQPLGFLDALSVSHWTLEAFNAVFGFNPLTRVQELAFGDWERLAKTGVAIGRIGDGAHDVGYNVQGGVIALSSSWHGNAADAAHAYFTGLANGIADLKAPLGEMAKQYDQIAHAVWSASEALAGIIKSLLDAAIVAGIAAVAGTLTAETGVGALIGYGVAAVEVANMLRLWSNATGVMQHCYNAIMLASGVIFGAAGDLDASSLGLLPGSGGYDHPLVQA